MSKATIKKLIMKKAEAARDRMKERNGGELPKKHTTLGGPGKKRPRAPKKPAAHPFSDEL